MHNSQFTMHNECAACGGVFREAGKTGNQCEM